MCCISWVFDHLVFTSKHADVERFQFEGCFFFFLNIAMLLHMHSHNCHSMIMSFGRSMASAVTEQQLRCGLCQNVFNNPVSIPCGHNYCRGCIKSHWDARTTCECPICEKAFKLRPDLRVNWVLHDITEQFKRSRMLVLKTLKSLNYPYFSIIH